MTHHDPASGQGNDDSSRRLIGHFPMNLPISWKSGAATLAAVFSLAVFSSGEEPRIGPPAPPEAVSPAEPNPAPPAAIGTDEPAPTPQPVAESGPAAPQSPGKKTPAGPGEIWLSGYYLSGSNMKLSRLGTAAKKTASPVFSDPPATEAKKRRKAPSLRRSGESGRWHFGTMVRW